ncbi:hypothetical protein TNCV_4040391 [Trichonephila clavipes]|nr:hypothetical protein TNCV_4040391 [Trichonephila clavipes]
MDSWPICNEFEPSTTEDPSCREEMHVKSVEAQTSSRWCGSENPTFLEDTSMPYPGFEPEPTRLQAQCHNHHTRWGGDPICDL